LIEERTNTEEKERAFVKSKMQFENETLPYMLRNLSTKRSVTVSGAALVQKIYPIYAKNEHPKHALDFRTNFYYPEKYLAGNYIDTKVFNVLIIWVMTLFLFVAVYFDWLRKIVGGKRY